MYVLPNFSVSADHVLFVVLHPRYKTTYFIKAKWPQEWITTAEELLREQWAKYYKAKDKLAMPSTLTTVGNFVF